MWNIRCLISLLDSRAPHESFRPRPRSSSHSQRLGVSSETCPAAVRRPTRIAPADCSRRARRLPGGSLVSLRRLRGDDSLDGSLGDPRQRLVGGWWLTRCLGDRLMVHWLLMIDDRSRRVVDRYLARRSHVLRGITPRRDVAKTLRPRHQTSSAYHG